MSVALREDILAGASCPLQGLLDVAVIGDDSPAIMVLQGLAAVCRSTKATRLTWLPSRPSSQLVLKGQVARHINPFCGDDDRDGFVEAVPASHLALPIHRIIPLPAGTQPLTWIHRAAAAVEPTATRTSGSAPPGGHAASASPPQTSVTGIWGDTGTNVMSWDTSTSKFSALSFDATLSAVPPAVASTGASASPASDSSIGAAPSVKGGGGGYPLTAASAASSLSQGSHHRLTASFSPVTGSHVTPAASRKKSSAAAAILVGPTFSPLPVDAVVDCSGPVRLWSRRRQDGVPPSPSGAHHFAAIVSVDARASAPPFASGRDVILSSDHNDNGGSCTTDSYKLRPRPGACHVWEGTDACSLFTFIDDRFGPQEPTTRVGIPVLCSRPAMSLDERIAAESDGEDGSGNDSDTTNTGDDDDDDEHHDSVSAAGGQRGTPSSLNAKGGRPLSRAFLRRDPRLQWHLITDSRHAALATARQYAGVHIKAVESAVSVVVGGANDETTTFPLQPTTSAALALAGQNLVVAYREPRLWIHLNVPCGAASTSTKPLEAPSPMLRYLGTCCLSDRPVVWPIAIALEYPATCLHLKLFPAPVASSSSTSIRRPDGIGDQAVSITDEDLRCLRDALDECPIYQGSDISEPTAIDACRRPSSAPAVLALRHLDASVLPTSGDPRPSPSSGGGFLRDAKIFVDTFCRPLSCLTALDVSGHVAIGTDLVVLLATTVSPMVLRRLRRLSLARMGLCHSVLRDIPSIAASSSHGGRLRHILADARSLTVSELLENVDDSNDDSGDDVTHQQQQQQQPTTAAEAVNSLYRLGRRLPLLEHLDVSENAQLGVDGLAAIFAGRDARRSRQQANVTTLDVAHCGLGDMGDANHDADGSNKEKASSRSHAWVIVSRHLRGHRGGDGREGGGAPPLLLDVSGNNLSDTHLGYLVSAFQPSAMDATASATASVSPVRLVVDGNPQISASATASAIRAVLSFATRPSDRVVSGPATSAGTTVLSFARCQPLDLANAARIAQDIVQYRRDPTRRLPDAIISLPIGSTQSEQYCALVVEKALSHAAGHAVRFPAAAATPPSVSRCYVLDKRDAQWWPAVMSLGVLASYGRGVEEAAGTTDCVAPPRSTPPARLLTSSLPALVCGATEPCPTSAPALVPGCAEDCSSESRCAPCVVVYPECVHFLDNQSAGSRGLHEPSMSPFHTVASALHRLGERMDSHPAGPSTERRPNVIVTSNFVSAVQNALCGSLFLPDSAVSLPKETAAPPNPLPRDALLRSRIHQTMSCGWTYLLEKAIGLLPDDDDQMEGDAATRGPRRRSAPPQREGVAACTTPNDGTYHIMLTAAPGEAHSGGRGRSISVRCLSSSDVTETACRSHDKRSASASIGQFVDADVVVFLPAFSSLRLREMSLLDEAPRSTHQGRADDDEINTNSPSAASLPTFDLGVAHDSDGYFLACAQQQQPLHSAASTALRTDVEGTHSAYVAYLAAVTEGLLLRMFVRLAVYQATLHHETGSTEVRALAAQTEAFLRGGYNDREHHRRTGGSAVHDALIAVERMLCTLENRAPTVVYAPPSSWADDARAAFVSANAQRLLSVAWAPGANTVDASGIPTTGAASAGTGSVKAVAAANKDDNKRVSRGPLAAQSGVPVPQGGAAAAGRGLSAASPKQGTTQPVATGGAARSTAGIPEAGPLPSVRVPATSPGEGARSTAALPLDVVLWGHLSVEFVSPAFLTVDGSSTCRSSVASFAVPPGDTWHAMSEWLRKAVAPT